MQQVAYAVVQAGTNLLGMVQQNLDWARISRDRYRKVKMDDSIQVCPVYIGAPIPEEVSAPIVLSKGESVG